MPKLQYQTKMTTQQIIEELKTVSLPTDCSCGDPICQSTHEESGTISVTLDPFVAIPASEKTKLMLIRKDYKPNYE